ncbi:flavin reductase family protein [Duganella sp. FT92W]|uniref:Flavin reductase family protein n=1 Tax=Pseudoduganella rivuli TaxID=2666085 RepID=A0A7X2LXZ9_9BURK|nr:flavin reductase family protein [Pseudoduganella rivuli]MRV76712.1 flavin reductase family protein [Pseudoduganella rivuli]
MFKEMAPEKAYRLLESGPVVLVTTQSEQGPNVMTMGFHMMLQHEPPLVGCVIGPWDYSHAALIESAECVLSLPTIEMAEVVTKIGNCSGSEVDKFDAFGLTARPAATVAPPLVAECLANLECRVVDRSLASRYNFFVLEVQRIWVNENKPERRLIHHAGDGVFIADGETVDMSRYMTRWQYLMD